MATTTTIFCRSQVATLLLFGWVLLVEIQSTAQAQATYSLSGNVRRDADGNGNPFEFDTPMAGVIMRLYSDPNGNGNHLDDGTLLKVTATDSGGDYRFENLLNGSYVIEQVDSPGASSTFDTKGLFTDSLSAVTIAGNNLEALDFLDFGTQLFAVAGHVYADGPANDSLFGLDDQPVGAVLVELFADLDLNGLVSSGDVLIGEAVTTLKGQYGFGGLVQGGYVVREQDPVGATSVNDRQGSPTDNQVAVTLTFSDVTNADFLDAGVSLAAIRGAVRDDLNANGNPNDPDPPLAGVLLLLFTDPNADGNPFDGTAIALTTTDLQGRYQYSNLPPGSYAIFQFAPQGASSTWDAQGSLTDGIVGVTLTGTDVTNRDFLSAGALTGTASGVIYADGANQNGLFTPDDATVAGVSVRLYADLDGDTNISEDDVYLGITTSLGNGSYAFSRLVYGLYVAQEVVPAGASAVNDMAGSPNDAQIGFEQSSSSFQNLLFLNQGIALASVSGSVRNDLDGDGDPSDPDPPLPNVPVRLFSDPNADGDPADGQLIASTITNAQGNYTFTGLAPNDYVIQASDVLGATSTYDTDGSLTDNRIRLHLTGTNVTGRNFLDTGAILAGISGFVYNDGPANNGTFSADDVPLAAVFIRLYADQNGDGLAGLEDPLITTTVTNRSGAYSFAGMPGGNYVVTELDPPGASSLLDSHGNPTDNAIGVTLSGTNVTGRNFLDKNASISSIIGYVRDDADSDGDPADPDQPIAGVTVRIYIDLTSNGLLDPEDVYLDTAKTSVNGRFIFSGLTGGSYLLQETDPRGGISTGDSQGANDNLVAVQLANLDDASAVFLDAYDPTGYLYDAITGAIIPGGVVNVTGPGAVSLVMNGASGQYVFETNGTPGTYTLNVVPPAGYILAPFRSAVPTPLVPAGQPDPAAVGSGENPASPGSLTLSTAVANPFYLQMTLAAGDPLVINNNFPLLRQDAPTFAYWSAWKPGAGGNPASNLDGDITNDLLEYAFDTDPASGLVSSPRFRVQYSSGTGKFTASYTAREQGHEDISIKIQVLQNLSGSPAGWTNATGSLTSVSNGDGSRNFTLANLELEPGFAGLEFGFVRFLVSLDADHNGIPEATAATRVLGWQRRTLPVGISSWSAPLASAPATELTGRITAVSGSSLDLSGALTGQGNFPAATFAGHILEILNGPHAGHRLLVDSAASSGTLAAVQLASSHSTLTSLPGTLVNASFALRPLRTLGASFVPASFFATNNANTADRVILYSNASQSFTTYWLFSGGGNPYWVLTGDATLASRNNVLLDSAHGALVHRRTATLVQPATGMVLSNPFVFRLGTGQSLIGTPWPLVQSPLSRILTTVNGFTGGPSASAADAFSAVTADFTPGSAGYTSYFLLKTGAMEHWVRQGDATLQNRSAELLFLPGRAVFWKDVDGLPAFTLPAPWTP